MSLRKTKYLPIKLFGIIFIVFSIFYVLFAVVLQMPQFKRASADSLVFYGIGVMGDSISDEYRANDNRGGAYAATTLNWLELLANNRNLNFGEWGTWGGARRTGYSYNWAQSGATSATLLTLGQHTGLAEQVRNGQVSLVYVSIGANDFAFYRSEYGQIYNGTLSGAALDRYIADVTRNIETAVNSVYSLGTAKLMISTIGDTGNAPLAVAQFPDATKRRRVSDAINRVNNNIRSLAVDKDAALLDFDIVTTELLGRVDSNGNINVGGQLISFRSSGDEPHHVILSDNRHAGTVYSGVLANYWMRAANAKFGTSLEPFTDSEILTAAGILRSSPTPNVGTATNRPDVVATPRVTPGGKVRATPSGRKP